MLTPMQIINLYLGIIILTKSQICMCFLGADLLEIVMACWKYIEWL